MDFTNLTSDEYLEHTEPATNALFNAILVEENRQPEVDRLILEAERCYGEFSAKEELDDVDPFRSQHYYACFSEAQKQSELIQFSKDILCAAILQIAKQGIALLVDSEQKYTKGRDIGRQKLSAVIWHSRNQSMHWEEGIPTNALTRECFEILTLDFGEQFDLNMHLGNKSRDILGLIAWRGYDNYRTDMVSILE